MPVILKDCYWWDLCNGDVSTGFCFQNWQRNMRPITKWLQFSVNSASFSSTIAYWHSHLANRLIISCLYISQIFEKVTWGEIKRNKGLVVKLNSFDLFLIPSNFSDVLLVVTAPKAYSVLLEALSLLEVTEQCLKPSSEVLALGQHCGESPFQLPACLKWGPMVFHHCHITVTWVPCRSSLDKQICQGKSDTSFFYSFLLFPLINRIVMMMKK